MLVQQAASESEGRQQVAVGGTIAKRYRIGERLGEGGMAVVHRGWHTLFDQPIAIKILKPEYWQNQEAVARFLQEARALARLRGMHVPGVLDIGRIESGAPFMVTELLDGDDLGHLLATQGPLPIERAVRLVFAACDAIGAAHEKGIVHRDLKPENLFLVDSTHAPLIKVLDFGVAKRLDAGNATDTKQSLGSPHYMAPEQIVTPAEVDVRADIWSLGIVLFELLTGRVPFDGPNVRSVCIATVRAECPPPSSLRPEVPPELDAVVLKCLQKRPEQRFASAQELKAALEGLVGVESFEALDDDDVTDLNQAELDVPVTVCIELDDFDAERGVAETEPVPTELPRPRASRWRAPVLVALAAALVAAVFGVWPPARDAAHHVALAHAATLVTIQSAKEDVTTAMRHWKRMNLALPTLGGDAPQVELALEPPVQPEVGEPHAITPEPRAKRAALPPATVQGVRTHEPALWKPRYALHPEGPWQPRSPEHGERIGDADLIDPYPDR